MIIGVIAVLLVLGVWVAGYFLSLPLWLKLLVTLFAIGLVVGAFFFRRWRAKRSAQALENELMKQAELQAANARPDRRAEIYELQSQFKKGLEALKASKLGATGGALYALPWYMIVGPPGAGKTTALRHSGLVFPFAGKDGKGDASLKGVGGTRNCDWWFTNDAILLDTAGRFATHEEDREEWSAFLDMLRRYRAKKPVNGVLVAISVSDVAGATEEQLETMGKTLRARIDEVMTRLQMIVPVYLVFTKIDLVAGFVEFFEDMKKSERAQLWGMTFPLESKVPIDPNKAFEAEFDVLVESLHAQAIRRIADVRQVEKRARVLQFPIEMRALRGSLSEFVGALLSKNTYQETPLFRGVYFTSGTQEGRPLDRVMAGMARAFGLAPQSLPPEGGPAATADAKSYFLTDLFGKVIFPDQNVAGRTLAETRRQLLARVAYASLAVAISAFIAVPALISYANNQELVRGSVQDAQIAIKLDATPNKLDQLEPMRKRVMGLEDWHDKRPPVLYRWGMYTGETLRAPLEEEYASIVGRQLSRTVKTSLEERLRSIDAGGGRSPEEFNRHYDNLKKYLMLTAGPEKLDASWSDWASPRIAQSWAELVGATSAEDRAIALENVKQYFLIVGPHPLPRDDRLVARARSELLRTPQMGALYETLVRDTNTEIAPIRKETIFYGSIAPFVSAKRGLKVDGAYTKLGWAKIRRLLDAERSKLLSEGWVLGTTTQLSDADIAKQVQVLRQIYFERFRGAWRDFIADLEIGQPKNAEAALEQLLALSEPEWPYLRLVRILEENVSLELTDAEAGQANSLVQIATDFAKAKVLGQPADAGGALLDRERPQSPVEVAFKPITVFGMGPKAKAEGTPQPTGLGQYQAILRKLVGVLTDMKDAKAAPDPKAITGEFEAAFRSTTSLLADQDAFTRPLLTPLLLNPITLAWASVLRDAGGAAGGLWEVSVWRAWSNKLEPAYPFSETALGDAKLEDFAEFFRPQSGQLWGFYEQSLKGSIDREGGEFIPTRRFKSAVPYSPAFLNCLKRGAKVTEATFAAGADGKTPAVSFELNLHSVSPDVAEVAIDIDGVSHTYANTPEQWVTMQWPAKEAKVRGARVRVRGFSGLSEEIVRMGDFGFFRMLEAADVRPGAAASAKPSDAPVLVATWKLRSQTGSLVKMDIRPTRSEGPFTRGFFSSVRCPRLVTSGDR